MAKKPVNAKQTRPFYGPGRVRGLDAAQYLTLSRLVTSGKTTWAELEHKGLALPSRLKSDYRQYIEKKLATK